jgi:hemerythrin-like metal-binding protein
MALMTWRNQYSVGVETLDDQHKSLMKALNELHAASMRGQAQKVAGPLLSQLVSLASGHFSAEEKLMESIKFPGLALHRAKHKELAGMIAEFFTRHEKGDTTVYTQLLYFMRDWQTKHMQTEDQDYAGWLRAHGVK